VSEQPEAATLPVACTLHGMKVLLLPVLQKLLILGWGDGALMTDLLSELDHGPSALPKGSEVTLFNTRSSQEVMGISDTPHQSLQWLYLIAFSCVWLIRLFSKDMSLPKVRCVQS